MSEIAVRVEGLGKRYRIAHLQQRHDTLRDALAYAARGALRRVASGRKHRDPDENTFWALRDISFEVERGDVVGIIGANGAGKSTLLKILSRITEPTEGEAEVRGRVGSLLEVGTGFNWELSGRENIYLNGAILGMKRSEITRKFDEIVDFSEVGRFIDTPVKHYSSGMYLRLAFAVAAHLEPEILIVDEVLAVGDAAFQKKCLGKMGSAAREGRTVLFVSHNMAAVQSLCRTAMLLRNGAVARAGSVSDVTSEYLHNLERVAAKELRDRKDRRGQGRVMLMRVDISLDSDHPTGVLAIGHPARFAFHVDQLCPGLSVWFTIYDQYGHPIASFNSRCHGPEDAQGTDRNAGLLCEVPELLLVPGEYRINAAVYIDGELQDHVEGAGSFRVAEGTLDGRPMIAHSGQGNVRFHHRWTLPPGT